MPRIGQDARHARCSHRRRRTHADRPCAAKGSLVDARPDDLAAFAVRSALAKVPELQHGDIVDVMVGCGFPQEKQGMNLGRRVALLAGLPATVPGTVAGSPASRATRRARFMPCFSCGKPQPTITSTISPCGSPGTFASALRTANAARSSGRASTRDPLAARPIGVRAAATMTASGMPRILPDARHARKGLGSSGARRGPRTACPAAGTRGSRTSRA